MEPSGRNQWQMEHPRKRLEQPDPQPAATTATVSEQSGMDARILRPIALNGRFSLLAYYFGT